VSYASDFVADKVLSKFIDLKRDELVSFILASDGSTEYANLRGHLFERYCHKILFEGGQFQVRSLSEPTKKQELLEVKRSLNWDRVDSSFTVAGQNAESYYCPISRTYGAVDSWKKDIGFFQITINPEHGIKMVEMEKSISYSKPRLYFVVPSAIFPTYSKQNFLTAKGKVAKQIPFALTKLEQYALCINLDMNSAEKRKPEDELVSDVSLKKMKT